MRRPKKPKRPPGTRWIYPRWREGKQRWEWAPAPRVDGKLVWGKSHVDPEAAYAAAKDTIARKKVVADVGELTLKQACERAVDRLLADGGSDYTAKGYRARFSRWYEILSENAPVVAITADDVEHLKAKRRGEQGVGSNTIRTDLVVLQRVLDLAGLTGDKNPVRGVSRPKAIEPHRPFLTMDVVRDIAKRIRASGKDEAEWHATVITFLAITGPRAYEIERLRAAHIEDLAGGGVAVVLHGVKGSRKVARRVYVAPGLAHVVRTFVAEASDKPPLAPSTIATICKRWRRELNMPHLSGRVLRRTFATEVSRHAPLNYVQASMGHSQLTTTQKYLGLDPRLAQAAAEQLHSSLAGTAPPASPPPHPTPAADSATPGTQATPPATHPAAATPSSESHGQT